MPLNCNIKTDQQKRGILPSQILIDLIRVEEFFSSIDNGFEQISSFEERTYFYARPYLFDKHARMGFINIQSKDQGFPNFPIYYQSSSGEPYRFQNFWKMGGGFFTESPSVSNPFSYYTEAKSHLFHGVFLGNLTALPAGTPYYSYLGSLMISDIENKVIVASSYNYLALMGIDYESWSFSFGTFYPTYMINIYNQFREILASNVSPIFRLRYMNQNLETSLVLSKTNINKNTGITEFDLRANPNSFSTTTIDSFNLKTNLIKFNFSYQLFKTLKVSESLILLNGKYSEKMGSTLNNITFQHMTSLSELAFSFGDYITVRGYIVSFLANKNINFSNFSNNPKQSEHYVSYGSALEFVF